MRIRFGILLTLTILVSSAHASTAEITGFRYSTCASEICISVSAPEGSVSTLQQDFAAVGTKTEGAKLVILKNGKPRHEFTGEHIVSHLMTSSVSIDSATRLVIVNMKNGTFEVFEKSSAEKEVVR